MTERKTIGQRATELEKKAKELRQKEADQAEIRKAKDTLARLRGKKKT